MKMHDNLALMISFNMGEPWFFHSFLLWTAVTFPQDFQYTKIVKEARFGDPESS